MSKSASSNANSQAFKDESLQTMYQYFDRLVGLKKNDWQLMLPALSVKLAEKETELQEIGQPALIHYFIISGIARLYYITPEGKELNKGFYDENSMVGNLSALILNEPSRFAIETLESSIVIELDLKSFRELAYSNEGWLRVFNYCCQMMLVRNERREAELLTMSAKQRFLQFVRNFPGHLDRIPQYHVASYLGITPVALSKYKKQWLQDHKAD